MVDPGRSSVSQSFCRNRYIDARTRLRFVFRDAGFVLSVTFNNKKFTTKEVTVRGIVDSFDVEIIGALCLGMQCSSTIINAS
jgi:hypothetical protein